MGKLCTICNVEGKYKCPTCLVYYCSVACCKKHRENNCMVAKVEEPIETDMKENQYVTPSTVKTDTLELLRSDENLTEMLKTNPHLRNLLTTIDKAEDPEEIMQKAMQEPLFVEFADACLKVVDSETTD